MIKNNQVEVIDEKGDFIFRFQLNNQEVSKKDGDRFTNIIQTNIHNLLDIIIFTKDGKEVSVDGFKLMNESKVHKLW